MRGTTKLTLNNNKDAELWLPCGTCGCETSHKVILNAELSEDVDYGGFGVSSWDDYQIVQCQGCRHPSFRKVHTDTENEGYDPEEQYSFLVEEVSLYPSRLAGRTELRNSHCLPYQVRGVYQETRACLSNKNLILAGIGIRALVESVCRDKKAEGNNLADKIDHLVSQQVLTVSGAEILHGLRLMGNKAAHEVMPQPENDLHIAFDVVENLLENVYVIPEIASRLRVNEAAGLEQTENAT